MTVVSQPVVEIRGDYAPLTKALNEAKTKVGNFVSYIDQASRKVAGAFDRMEWAVKSLDYQLGLLNTTVTRNLSPNFKTLAAEIYQATGELKNAATESAVTRGEFDALTTAIKDQSTAFRSEIYAVQSLISELGRLASRLKTVQSQANTPINIQGRTSTFTKKMGGHAGAFGLALLAQGVLGAEYEAVKTTGEFDDAITRLYATAGMTMPLDSLKTQIYEISQAFGQLPIDVAKGLYPIASLGFRDADALKVLANAMNLAKGNMIDGAVAGNLLAKTLVAYGLGANNAREVTDVLTRAIKDSDQPAQDFAGAMLNLIKPASMLGLSYQETAAALALNINTTKNAARGSTQLIALFSDMVHPTAAQRKAAHALGLEWFATGKAISHIKEVGLENALNEINKATHGSSKALGDLYPDLRKIGGAYGLLNTVGRSYKGTLDDVTNSIGATDKASKKMNDSLGQSQRNFQTAFQIFQTKLGDALKPFLTSALQALTRFLDVISNLPPQVLEGAAAFVTLSAVTATVIGAIALLGETLSAAIEPILIVAAVGTTLYAAWRSNFLNIQGLTKEFGQFLSKGFHDIAVWAVTQWFRLTDELKSLWKNSSSEIEDSLKAFEDDFKAMLPILKGVFSALLTVIKLWADTVGLLWRSLLRTLVLDLDLFVDAATGNWSRFFNHLKSILGDEGKDITSTFSGFWDNMTDVMAGKIVRMTAMWQEFLKMMKDSSGDLDKSMAAATTAGDIAESAYLSAQRSTEVGQEGGPGSDLGKRIVEHAFDNISTPKNVASCALFVSDVFRRAGANIPTPIASAEGLAHWVASGGAGPTSSHDISQARPGDLIVFHGPRYGARQGGGARSGYHVAIALGNGMMRQSSDGRVTTSSISGTLRTMGGSATAYTVGASAQSRAEDIVDNAMSKVSDFTKSLEKMLGPESNKALYPVGKNYSDFGVDTSKKGKSPGFMAEPMADVFGKDSVIGDKVKEIETYVNGLSDAAKKSHDLTSETQQLLSVQKEFEDQAKKSGKEIDQHALKVALDTVKLGFLRSEYTRVNNAVFSGTRELKLHSEELLHLKNNFESARSAQERFYKEHKGRISSPAVKAQYHQLTLNTRDAERAAANLEGHMYRLMNHIKSAVQEQARLASEISSTKSAIAEQMHAAREAQLSVQKEIEDAIKGVTPKDDILNRQKEVIQKAMEMERALEASHPSDADLRKGQEDIQKYQELALGMISNEVATRARRQALDLQKFLLDTGRETFDQYQSTVRAMLNGMIDSFEQAGYADEGLAADISTLATELQKQGWQDIDDELTSLKESLDDGDISTKQYIEDLQRLMTLPGFRQSPEYKKTVSALDAEYKRMAKEQQKQADKLGKEIGDPIAQALVDAVEKRGNSLKEAIKGIAKKALEDSVKRSVENLVSDYALKVIQKKHPIPQRAKSEADKMLDVQVKFQDVVDKWNSGVSTLGSIVDRFVAALSRYDSATASSAAGPGGTSPIQTQGGTSKSSIPGGVGALSSATSNLALVTHDKALKGYSQTVGAVSDIASSVSDLSEKKLLPGVQAVNDIVKTVGTLSKSASLTKFAGAAAPWLGLAGSLLALGGLFGGSGKVSPSVLREETFSKVFSSLGSKIDSGYSGSSGLRQLLGAASASSAGVHPLGFTPGPQVKELHVHAHGIDDPATFARVAAPMVMDEIAKQSTIDNARRGGGYSV